MPDSLELLVLGEGRLGVVQIIGDDWDNDVATALAWSRAHHTAHHLNQLQLRLARVHQDDAIEGRNIQALTAAAHITEDMAHVLIRLSGKPLQGLALGYRIHRAIDMTAIAAQLMAQHIGDLGLHSLIMGLKALQRKDMLSIGVDRLLQVRAKLLGAELTRIVV